MSEPLAEVWFTAFNSEPSKVEGPMPITEAQALAVQKGFGYFVKLLDSNDTVENDVDV